MAAQTSKTTQPDYIPGPEIVITIMVPELKLRDRLLGRTSDDAERGGGLLANFDADGRKFCVPAADRLDRSQ